MSTLQNTKYRMKGTVQTKSTVKPQTHIYAITQNLIKCNSWKLQALAPWRIQGPLSGVCSASAQLSRSCAGSVPRPCQECITGGWVCSSVVEGLPGMHESLGSIPSTSKQNKNPKRKKKKSIARIRTLITIMFTSGKVRT